MNSPELGGERPQSASGGLERAAVLPLTARGEDALASLHSAAAALAVTVDVNGRPTSVIPLRTLRAARPGEQLAACKPAWPAAVFVEPADEGEAEQFAGRPDEEIRAGQRIVVVRAGQVVGVVPVPDLINRPGTTSRLLEAALTRLGLIIFRIRYRSQLKSEPGQLERFAWSRAPELGRRPGRRAA